MISLALNKKEKRGFFENLFVLSYMPFREQ